MKREINELKSSNELISTVLEQVVIMTKNAAKLFKRP